MARADAPIGLFVGKKAQPAESDGNAIELQSETSHGPLVQLALNRYPDANRDCPQSCGVGTAGASDRSIGSEIG